MDDWHGTPVPDPYRWLEDPADDDTQVWVKEQDRYWQSVRDSLPSLQTWRERVAKCLDVDFETAPIWRGDTKFVMRHVRGMTRPGLFVTLPNGETRNLLDDLPDPYAASGAMHAWKPSLEGNRLALTLSTAGSEDASLYVMDVASGQMIDGPIPGCGHTSIAWLPGSQSLYYARSDGQRRDVLLHHLGMANDELIFAGGQLYSLNASDDGTWLAISVSDGSPASGNDLWLVDGFRRTRQIQERAAGSSGITFGPDGLLYLLTNREAPNWRIMVTAPENPYYPNWTELVAADETAVLTDFAIVSSHLLVSWSRDAVSEISLHDKATGARIGEIPLPAVGKVGPLVTRRDDHERVWFSYTDSTTPPQPVEHRLFAEGANAAIATGSTQRLWCTSPDGTRIQMIAVRPHETDRPVPTILCGYGGFGTPLLPTYSASTMAWVRSGGTYVIANVRGGGERGELWHAAGRGGKKQNAIDDFVACAQFLLAQGWTTASQLAIWGGSNGGLLISAALAQQPELFSAAVCFAPLCDMLRYDQTGIGAVWRSEYGSATVAEDFAHLHSYSPYHRVQPASPYPATLFAVSEADERVDPMHARKMSAALQHSTTGTGPIVLRRDHNVGHSGRAMASAVELTGDVLAFMAAYTGLVLR